ncbi:uncharacterized protein LOC134266654 [Saccostrea cucullata]|uniref:uncharacterized protein LOC134266654 n=1 Tax=Saccostrea cuccullata TaxID=36930 RepID=UPI002ED37BC0
MHVISYAFMKNIALCQHNDYHNSETFHLQEPAMYRTQEISDYGCIGNQTISAFIYLDETQLKTVVSCETGYLATFPKCGNGSYRKTITLQAQEELNSIHGPFVMTKDVIGHRSLLSITCYTTTGTFHAETSKHIRWCIRTVKDKHFKILPLQEEPNEEIFKTSFGINSRAVFFINCQKTLKM